MSGNVELDSIRELRKFYESVRIAATETILDIHHSLENQVIINLDLSALYAYLLGAKDAKTQKFDFAAIQLCQQLIESQADLPFVAVMTSPTFWEMMAAYVRTIKAHHGEVIKIADFEDHLDSKIRHIESIMKDQAAQGLINNDIDAEVNYLSRITGDLVSGSVQRLRRLVGGQGPIRGLGEVFQKVSDVTRIDDAAFDDLLNKMFSIRGPRDVGRDLDNKNFRYRVDCANILLSRSVSASIKLSARMDYVTKASYKQQFCDDVGRIPLSPLFWLRVRKIPDLRDDKDHKSFLSKIQKDAGQLFREIGSRDVLPKEGTALWADISAFQARVDLLMYDNSSEETASDRLLRIKRAVGYESKTLSVKKYDMKGVLESASSIIGDELDLSAKIVDNEVLKEVKSHQGGMF